LFDRKSSAHCLHPQFTTLQYSSPGTATAQSVTFLYCWLFFGFAFRIHDQIIAAGVLLFSRLYWCCLNHYGFLKLYQIVVSVLAVFKSLNLFRCGRINLISRQECYSSNHLLPSFLCSPMFVVASLSNCKEPFIHFTYHFSYSLATSHMILSTLYPKPSPCAPILVFVETLRDQELCIRQPI
jgi:hypothetical protein